MANETRTEIVQQIKRSRSRLRIEVGYEECCGNPNYGSVRTSMSATLILTPEYAQPDKAGEVAEMMRGMADSMRSRVEKRNDIAYPEAVKRALRFADVRAALEQEHTAARQIEAAGRDQQRRNNEAAAKQNGWPAEPPPQNGQRITEGDWNGTEIVPRQAPPRQQAPPPRNDPPPVRQPQSVPQRQGEPSPRGQSDRAGTPPRGAKEFSGWIQRQPKEVQEVVKDLMSQEGWGWRYMDLDNDQAMWLYRQTLTAAPTNGAAY